MRFSQWLYGFLPPGILVISLALIYLMTIAPGLTWANHGSDGGDLITATATGGVAHPTGYPVYLLLASAFQRLPIGSLAFRTNLMSALAAVIASMLMYGLVVRSLSTRNGKRHWLAGLAAAYAFGLAPLLWSQAVITEVYALHALFIALILLLSTVPLPLTSKQLDCALGLVFGLAMGNHMTTILMLPIILFSTVSRRSALPNGLSSAPPHLWSSFQLDGRSLVQRLVWLGAGLLVYLTLPLRAMSQPPVNWGNPVTLDNFGWLVSGRLYHNELFTLTLPSLWLRIQSAAALLVDQFGLPGLVVGLIGLVFFFTPSVLYRNTFWVTAVLLAFAVGYATDDSYLYLIPVMLCFAVWIGLGLAGIMDAITRRFPRIGLASGLIFLAYLILAAGRHWPGVDASQDLRADRFGEAVLAKAPPNAIVFAKGDEAVFAMWYFHYALCERPDLVVVATDLLSFDWYQETLHSNYPSLILPGHFPFAERLAALNPERPFCYIEYIQSTDIHCLPAKAP